MNYLKSKKGGIAETAVKVFINIILTIAILIAVVLITNNNIVKSVDSNPINAEVFVYRTLYTHGGFSFTDPITQINKAGIIDKSKFSDEHMEKMTDAIFYGDRNRVLAAKIELGSETIYFNRDYYNIAAPLSTGIIQNTPDRRIMKLPVTIYDGTKYEAAIITYDVVMAK